MNKYKSARDAGGVDASDAETISGASTWLGSGPEGCHAVVEMLVENGRLVNNEYTKAPSDSMVEYQETLNARFAECIIKIILGDEPVEYYDTFLEEWYNSGGQEMNDDAQAFYDSNKK